MMLFGVKQLTINEVLWCCNYLFLNLTSWWHIGLGTPNFLWRSNSFLTIRYGLPVSTQRITDATISSSDFHMISSHIITETHSGIFTSLVSVLQVIAIVSSHPNDSVAGEIKFSADWIITIPLPSGFDSITVHHSVLTSFRGWRSYANVSL